MRGPVALPRLHLVTDDAVLEAAGFAATATAIMNACGSALVLHLRGHGTSAAVLNRLGEELSAAALRYGAWLLVNDRVDVAMAVRANGVQLGAAALQVADARRLLGGGAVIGYSAHGALEAVQAAADGADFVLAGTIYGSASHPERAAAGVGLLQECAARTPAPVIAIGGITPERVAEVAAMGAHGVAVLGGVWHADDAAAAVVAYLEQVRAAWDGAPQEGTRMQP